jgi:hypothetical protein
MRFSKFQLVIRCSSSAFVAPGDREGIQKIMRNESRAPDWTESQFAYLYANPMLTAADLSPRIGRSVGAIETVRSFILSWRSGGNVSGLSKMMLAFLSSREAPVGR